MSIGDTIQCADIADMVSLADDLANHGYGVSLLFKDLTVKIVSLPEDQE